MAINFGTAARNAASDIVKRRRGNPDPDGVIASRVADQIVQNSSRDIGAFLKSAPALNPAPRAREVASDNARFMGAPAPFPTAPQPQYPSGGVTASPFVTMPAPPTLLPGMQERMDPETIAVLRYLGLI